MIYQKRNRTKLEDISYALHLYFDGLSLDSSKPYQDLLKEITQQ